jgi:hypothetical protein
VKRRFTIAANWLDKRGQIFSKLGVETDLNQAEDIFPAGFFVSSGPAIGITTKRGQKKEKT